MTSIHMVPMQAGQSATALQFYNKPCLVGLIGGLALVSSARKVKVNKTKQNGTKQNKTKNSRQQHDSNGDSKDYV